MCATTASKWPRFKNPWCKFSSFLRARKWKRIFSQFQHQTRPFAPLWLTRRPQHHAHLRYLWLERCQAWYPDSGKHNVWVQLSNSMANESSVFTCMYSDTFANRFACMRANCKSLTCTGRALPTTRWARLHETVPCVKDTFSANGKVHTEETYWY